MDDCGRTALDFAQENGNQEMIELLHHEVDKSLSDFAVGVSFSIHRPAD